MIEYPWEGIPSRTDYRRPRHRPTIELTRVLWDPPEFE